MYFSLQEFDWSSKNAYEIAQMMATVKEQEAKSQHYENRVRNLNVNVENLNMYASLQHRTSLGLFKDHKCLFSPFH